MLCRSLILHAMPCSSYTIHYLCCHTQTSTISLPRHQTSSSSSCTPQWLVYSLRRQSLAANPRLGSFVLSLFFSSWFAVRSGRGLRSLDRQSLSDWRLMIWMSALRSVNFFGGCPANATLSLLPSPISLPFTAFNASWASSVVAKSTKT